MQNILIHTIMAVKKVLHKIWHILKPVLWLTLNLGMGALGKKAGSAGEAVSSTGTAVGTAIIDTIDEEFDEDEKKSAE